MGVGKVLVVGAGPCGTLAAIYLANRGYNVEVVEKRHSTQEDPNKAYVLVLSTRGNKAIKGAGAAPNWPGQVPCRGWVLHQYSGEPTFIPTRTPFTSLQQWGRSELASHLQSEAQRLHPRAITFSFGQTLVRLDLGARCAIVRDGEGQERAVRYDLLVGADGTHSRVRAAMEEQVPGIRVERLPTPAWYCSFPSLQVDPETLPRPPAGSPQLQDGAVVHFFQMRDVRSLAPRWRAPVTLSCVMEAGGNLRGTLFCADFTSQDPRKRYRTAADFDDILQQLPQLSPEVRAEIARRLAASEWSAAPARSCVSQLDGPRAVLLGDAAHSTSPASGQGCNSALEDAAVLNKVLEACGDDMDAAPAAFTARRLADARAVVWIDARSQFFFPKPAWHPQTLAVVHPQAVRWKLRQRYPQYGLAAPAVSRLLVGTEPYSRLRRDFERDAVALAAATAAAAAAVGAAVGGLVLSRL